ncbi:MAG: tetratricopeptide repeat protein [Cyclobacteriaceae bacterium]
MKVVLTVILLIMNLMLSDEDKALDMYQLAYDLDQKGKKTEALKTYIGAYSLYQQIGDKKNMAEILVNIGIMFYEVESFEKAVKMNKMALSMDKGVEKYALFNIAQAYSRNGRYADGLDYYEKSLRYHQENRNDHQLNKHYIELGIISYELEEYEQSRSYAITVRNRTRNDSSSIKLYVAALNNIGNSYLAQGDIDLAKRTFLECLAEYDRLGSESVRGITYNNLGKVYESLSELDSAIYYFKRGWHFNRGQNDVDETETSLVKLAEIYNELGNYDSALHYTQKIVGLIKRTTEKMNEYDKLALSKRLEMIQEQQLELMDSDPRKSALINLVLAGICFVVIVVFLVIWLRMRKFR